MLVLPRLSRLDLTIGKEDEMFTVNMLPARSYSAGIQENVFPGLGYGRVLSQDSLSLQTCGEVLYVYMCAISKCTGVMGNRTTLPVTQSPQKNRERLNCYIAT